MMLSRSPHVNSTSHFLTFDRSPIQLHHDSTYERRITSSSSRHAITNNLSYEGPTPITPVKYTSRYNPIQTTTKQPKIESQTQAGLTNDTSAIKSNNKHLAIDTKDEAAGGTRKIYYLSTAAGTPTGASTSSSYTNSSHRRQAKYSDEPRQLKQSASPLPTRSIEFSDRLGGHAQSFTVQTPSQSYDLTPKSSASNTNTHREALKVNSTSKAHFSAGKSQSISSKLSPKASLSSLPDGSASKNPVNEVKSINQLPNFEPTRCSVKSHGIIRAYAANTNQGLVRNYNEDRVSIILNINKPATRMSEKWPKCSFFGIFDGHGGRNCADFLRDNLHQFVINEPSFPTNPREAIMKGFDAAEKSFLELAQSNPSGEIDRSGSCAIVAMIVGDMCYVANVGDSRAIMSGERGQRIFSLSRDHKPTDDIEQKRIFENGGKIYQSQTPITKPSEDGKHQQPQIILGPHRVFPGRLSVSRTFGDIEAKLPKLGGNPGVVIATPDVKSFKISDEHDFIVLGCDGIYDKLSSKDSIRAVWKNVEEKTASDVHQQAGQAVESVLLEAVAQRTSDNITVVLVAFKNFEEKIFGERPQSPQNENADSNKNFISSYKYSNTYKRQDKEKTQRELESGLLRRANTNASLGSSDEKFSSAYLSRAKGDKTTERIGEKRPVSHYSMKSESVSEPSYLLNPDQGQRSRLKVGGY